MMKNRGKKITVVLLLALAVLGLGTVQASAATAAKIGKKGYSTFNAALKAAKAGQTIKLTKNCTFDINPSFFESLGFDKKLTVDLNGKKLTVTDRYSKTYQTSGSIDITQKVTVKNGTLVGSIDLYEGGEVALSNITFERMKKDNNIYVTALRDNTKATITKCKGKKVKFTAMGNNTKMTIKNTTISEECLIQAGLGYNDENSNVCSVTITGGSYTHKRAETGLEQEMLEVGPKGKLTINSGKFSVATDHVSVFRNSGTLVIKGGTFKNTKYSVGVNAGSLKISGGTFMVVSDLISSCIYNLNGFLKMTGGKVLAKGLYCCAIHSEGWDSRIEIEKGTVQSLKGSAYFIGDGKIKIGKKAKILSGQGV